MSIIAKVFFIILLMLSILFFLDWTKKQIQIIRLEYEIMQLEKELEKAYEELREIEEQEKENNE